MFAYEEWHFLLWAFHFAVCWLFYLNVQMLSVFNCMKSAVRATTLSSCLLEVAEEVLLNGYLLHCHVF